MKNNNELKLTLEEYRAILYRFLTYLAMADKINLKGLVMVTDICKTVDTIIKDAHEAGILKELVAKANEDDEVAELMELVDERYEEKKQEAMKKNPHNEEIKKILLEALEKILKG